MGSDATFTGGNSMRIVLSLLVSVAAVVPVCADLQVDPDHPYFFRDGTRHVYLLGVSDRAAFKVWENENGFHWRQYLQTLHQYGFNYVRQDVQSWIGVDNWQNYPGQFSNPDWAFLRTGPGKAIDGKPRFDLTRLNEEYFRERIRPFLQLAEDLGIYVELTLFESTGPGNWQGCLYNDANNVHGLGLRPGEPQSDRVLRNKRVLRMQEKFVEKVLGETDDSGNVIYEICNEGGGAAWVAHFVDFIHNRRPSALVSAGEQASKFDPVSGLNDIVVKHRGWGMGGGRYATDADAEAHHDALLRYRAGKPITHNEFFLYAHGSTDDPNFVRKMFWADFTACGHVNFYDFAHLKGPGYHPRPHWPPSKERTAQLPPEPIMDGGRYLRRFINRIPFWSLSPADDCVEVDSADTYAMAAAEAGRCYVVYLLGAQVEELLIDLPEGKYRGRWYDPKTGEFSPRQPVTARGGNTAVTVPPFEQDTVLLLQSD